MAAEQGVKHNIVFVEYSSKWQDYLRYLSVIMVTNVKSFDSHLYDCGFEFISKGDLPNIPGVGGVVGEHIV